MQTHLGHGPIPSTFIATLREEVVGSVAIVVSDMDSHPEFTPWLASLRVTPEARRQGIGKGIGKRLVQHVTGHARNLGTREIYRLTPEKADFYANPGGTALSRKTYRGHPVDVMKAEP